jgi:hypothetical protein
LTKHGTADSDFSGTNFFIPDGGINYNSFKSMGKFSFVLADQAANGTPMSGSTFNSITAVSNSGSGRTTIDATKNYYGNTNGPLDASSGSVNVGSVMPVNAKITYYPWLFCWDSNNKCIPDT